MEFSLLEPYEYDLVPNQRIPLDIVGNVIAIDLASAPLYIEMHGGQKAQVRQGVVMSAPAGVNYERFWLVNGATSQTVRLYAGAGDVQLPIPNVVEVKDGARVKTFNNEAFVALGAQTAIGGNYNHHQLRHEGAEKVISIDALHLTNITAAGEFQIFKWDTALGTLEKAGKSKLGSGAVDTLGFTREQYSASLMGTDAMWTIGVQAGDTKTFEFKNPHILAPGEGLMVRNNAVNQTTRVMFQYTVENDES